MTTDDHLSVLVVDEPVELGGLSTYYVAASPTASCGAVEVVGESSRAVAPVTAPGPTTALRGGRRIFLDLHPLEMRPLDNVAKAHQRSTSGSLGTSIGTRPSNKAISRTG